MRILSFFFVTVVTFVALVMTSVATTRQTAIETPASREDAYRANNLGVARLEQFDYPAAVQSFRRALETAPDLTMARVNLAIALYYAGELAPARREAEAARARDPGLLQADYVLGLVARAEDRTADAVDAFDRVQRADPEDVGSAINLGQVYLQEQKFAGAIEAFRRAVRLEPYQSTAAYGLATALLRSGAREEGAAAMARFQTLRDSGYATTFSQNYLDQGRYAAAIASTGAEPELVDTAMPEVAFSDRTTDLTPGRVTEPVSGVTLFDKDGDGDLDLALATHTGVRLLRNDYRGRFADATAGAGFPAGAATAVVAGDYDNDDRLDLLVLSSERSRLMHQEPDGSFKDVTTASGIPALASRTAAWADADHDGDLDIVSGSYLVRNNGNGTFADVTASARMPAVADALALAPTDFDNRRDIDFLVLRATGPPMLLQNMRDGSFRDAAETAGLVRAAHWTALASADANKDGFVDFFLARRDGPGIFATSDGHGRFRQTEAPARTLHSLAAQYLDYDNDGLLDLFVVTPRGPGLLRNVGTAWTDVTDRAFSGGSPVASPERATAGMASGDLDGDGDTDVVIAGSGGVEVWRNDGGNRRPSLTVRLSARVSNRSSTGAKVEMRAGSLSQQIETVSAAPSPAPADVVFGLGNRSGADVVRVLWPAGILQAEVAPDGKALSGTTAIRELDRKPSSCPYLYTWNGTSFEFVTDFLGGGEMGYLVAPGVRNTPDPDEYVRIDSRQLQSRNGRYDLRITNELEEALFLDHVLLIAVDHPEGTEVYPNEGMGDRAKPLGLHVTRRARPPLVAVDEHGHDVLDRVSTIDRAYIDDFALEHVRGYAKPHSLTLTLPAAGPNEGVLLLLTGWTDYAFSRDNLAASQQDLKLQPPSLQVRDTNGRWRTVIEDIGVPVGRPQTVPADLTGLLPPGATEVRIETTMRIYWDRVVVAEKASGFGLQASEDPNSTEAGPSSALRSTRLEPLDASLRWRGFSAEVSPDGRDPFVYDYARVTAESPWKLMPGRYTREGDVRELLARVDDMFVISRPGDAIALSFDAAALPPLPARWTRTFLLYADGFSKEMDPHSSSPDQLAPLPFHGMTQYPYAYPERYPDDDAHREYVRRYNTRTVLRSVPRIDLTASRERDR